MALQISSSIQLVQVPFDGIALKNLLGHGDAITQGLGLCVFPKRFYLQILVPLHMG